MKRTLLFFMLLLPSFLIAQASAANTGSGRLIEVNIHMHAPHGAGTSFYYNDGTGMTTFTPDDPQKPYSIRVLENTQIEVNLYVNGVIGLPEPEAAAVEGLGLLEYVTGGFPWNNTYWTLPITDDIGKPDIWIYTGRPYWDTAL